MIVNEKELLERMREEARGVSALANAPYREMLLGAIQLIEMRGNMNLALHQRDKEQRKLLKEAAANILRMQKELKRNMDLVAECKVSPGTDLKEMDEIGQAMTEDVIKKALLCGALRVERDTDIVHACKIVRVRMSVVAGSDFRESKK